jgi:hypothetical protein
MIMANKLVNIILGSALLLAPLTLQGCSSYSQKPSFEIIQEAEIRQTYDFERFVKAIGKQEKNVPFLSKIFFRGVWEATPYQDRKRACTLYEDPEIVYDIAYKKEGSLGKDYIDNFEIKFSKKEIKKMAADYPWMNPESLSLPDKILLYNKELEKAELKKK